MKIEAFTGNPAGLISAISKGIKDEKLKTWSEKNTSDNKIVYFHTPEQWGEKVLILPAILKDRVVFNLTHWSGKEAASKDIQGYVAGRFTEILLVHFSSYFSKLETTA